MVTLLWVLQLVLFLLSLAAPPVATRRQIIHHHRQLAFNAPPAPPQAQLPVIFLHGVLSNTRAGDRLAAKLAAAGRVFVPLAFCDDRCSVQALNAQVQLAIAQIRAVVQDDPTTFADGYVLVGHSQGGAIARAVVEEMDDHKVDTLVSLAGVVNGVFLGPQPRDAAAATLSMQSLLPNLVPLSIWNTSKYAPSDLNGTYQYDYELFLRAHPELQAQYSAFNLARSPVLDTAWLATNPFLPRLNNNRNACSLQAETTRTACERDQRRRRDNFLRLRAAHLFASPDDGVVAPWQTAILGQYSELASLEDLKTEFATMRVLGMKETREYVGDTYGLRTLDERGGVFLHTVAGVPHSCWVRDVLRFGSDHLCVFDDLYDRHIHSALVR